MAEGWTSISVPTSVRDEMLREMGLMQADAGRVVSFGALIMSLMKERREQREKVAK